MECTDSITNISEYKRIIMAKYIDIKGLSIQTTDTDPEAYGGSWSSGNNMNTGRTYLAGAGIQTAALGIAGYTGGGGPGYKAIVESYDGTSWTEIADLNTARIMPGGYGTSTAAHVMGGRVPSASDASETWNGTSWSEVAELGTARYGVAGDGITTAGIAYGGYTGSAYKDETEEWDGTSWTEVANLTGSVRLATSSTPQGTAQLAMCAGGQGVPPTSTASTVCEEWTQAQNVKTITD